MMHKTFLIAIFSLWTLLHIPILSLTNDLIKEPYMDETFHYHQALEIMNSPINPEWNPKITTPPGLYYVTLALTLGICDLRYFRFSSAFFNSLSLILVVLLLDKRGESPKRATLMGIQVLLFPPLFFVGQVYYTDSGSLFFLLLCWYLRENDKVFESLCAGLMAISFRQTNLIWILFIGGLGISDSLNLQIEELLSVSKLIHRLNERNWKLLLWRFSGYFILPIFTLAYFIRGNDGSIVAGDKENHKLSLHWAQVCYLSIFIAAFSGLGIDVIMSPRISLHQIWRSLNFLILNFACSLAFIHRFTIVHPFILADNRHYTFYLWSKFFNVYWANKYLITPLYAIALTLEQVEIINSSSLVSTMGFLVAVILSLVPLPLFEPRYFIVPFTCYSILTSRSRSERAFYMSISSLLVLNGLVLYIFWFKPFVWVDGSVARFMW